MFPTTRKSRKPSRAVSAKHSWMNYILWSCPLITIASVGFLFWSGPTITNCAFEETGNESQPCELPLRTKTEDNVDITLHVTMKRNVFSPSSFLIVPDDCLQSLIINGKLVDDPSLPLCDYTDGKTFHIDELLKTGTNSIEAIIHNNGGDAQFVMQPSWSNVSVAIPFFIAGVSLCMFFLVLMFRRKTMGWSTVMIILFLCATCIRIYYVTTTPYGVRAYDADGHIEYIEYIHHSLSLPDPSAGWEFWQPPLYYILSAVVYGAVDLFGGGREGALYGIQIFATLLSIWTLWLIAKIGLEIFTDKHEQGTALPLFFGLVACNPALVMLSARINNDVLIVPLMMLATLLIIRWWKHHKTALWYYAMIVIGLSILAKSSGLLLLPVTFICLIVAPSLSWKKKLREGVLGLFVVFLLAGWLNIYRSVADTGEYSVVANVDSLNTALEVDNGLRTYFTFNPARLVTIPYVSAWEDASGRNNFWEYVYRTGLFGEFDLGTSVKGIASWVVLWSLLLFVCSIAGFVRATRTWKSWLPLLLISVIVPLGHAVFRFQNPYSPSQDFRHVFVLLIPLAAFTILEIKRMPWAYLRSITTFCAQIFIALCCMLLLTL